MSVACLRLLERWGVGLHGAASHLDGVYDERQWKLEHPHLSNYPAVRIEGDYTHIAYPASSVCTPLLDYV